MPARPRPSRVLLLSDTHGRLHPQILALVGQVEHVVHAGDIGGPDVIAQLAGRTSSLTLVLGNNDVPRKWPAAAHPLLTGLPEQAALDLPGGTLAVEHGHRVNPVARRHALLRARYPDARLVLYGHSHRQLIDDDEQPWIVNPGAAGRSRTYGGAGCVLLSATPRRWQLQPLQFSLSDWKE